jgi:2-oxoglutarate ferredoxin oxidoreductase subunit gamma
MLVKTIFSGFGGQGVIMMGLLLAKAGMYENKNVTCLPSYGAQVRGGVANCTVSISDEDIASPVASEPDFGVLMNRSALLQYEAQIRSGGTVFLNSSLIDSQPVRRDFTVVTVPVNDLARPLGDDRVINMIMLGSFVKKTGLVSLKTAEQAIRDTFSNRDQVLKLNTSALHLGYDYLPCT